MVGRREFLASATGAAGILAKNAAGYDTVRIDGELRPSDASDPVYSASRKESLQTCHLLRDKSLL